MHSRSAARAGLTCAHTNPDCPRLDSYSGRVWFLPAPTLALQVSAGHLKEAEAGDGAEPRRDVDRFTATGTYHRIREGTVWASTFGWGRNSESGRATSALLLESSFTLADRDSWFARLEVADKTPHDLDVVTATGDRLTVTKIQAGYTRYFQAFRQFRAGIGAPRKRSSLS